MFDSLFTKSIYANVALYTSSGDDTDPKFLQSPNED